MDFYTGDNWLLRNAGSPDLSPTPIFLILEKQIGLIGIKNIQHKAQSTKQFRSL